MEEVVKVRFLLQYDNGLSDWRTVQPVSFNSQWDAEQAFHAIKDDTRHFLNRAQKFRIVQVVERKTVLKQLP